MFQPDLIPDKRLPQGYGQAAAGVCGPVELANLPYEPQLELDDIQGNVLSGFNKDHQTLIYVQLTEPIDRFRAWLGGVLPRISSAAEVVQFNRLFKGVSERLGNAGAHPWPVQSTWINISFSHAALTLLTAGTAGDLGQRDFADKAFTQGMAARAAQLGDSTDAAKEGSLANWKVGGTAAQRIDVLLIVASDTHAAMKEVVRELEAGLDAAGCFILGRDEGAANPEHTDPFGFRETISQPGVRGRCSPYPDDFLTPRQNPINTDEGLPGQLLVWPGEFVLGYPTEDDVAHGRNEVAATAKLDVPVVSTDKGPAWAVDGSFLVFRRLQLNTSEFEKQLSDQLAKLGADGVKLDETQLKARILGRWPNGAPLSSTKLEPPVGVADDDCTNNKFSFDNKALQQVCPVAAHIRKAYPRQGSPEEQRRHRILRRGIPYDNGADDRGLLFLAYQASITDQFEYITERMNNPDSGAPNAGHDLFVGQTPSGERYLTLPDRHRFRSPRPFVFPTGGEYFFTPSIFALQQLADATASWQPTVTLRMRQDRVKFAYYALGRFVYEQAPYATGPNLELSADFYHSARSGKMEIETAGLAKNYGIYPFRSKAPQLFNRSSNQLTDDDQMECLWWFFQGAVQHVTKAIRIPYQYTRPGQDTPVDAVLLIGFAGPGHE